jgi:hypothetical protein
LLPVPVEKMHCPVSVGGLTLGGPRDQTGQGQHIPRGFAPVAVVQCVSLVVQVKGRGRWLAQVKRIATSDLGPLMTALRKPSTPLGAGGPVECPMIAALLPWFELLGTNGQLIQPVLPRTSCGQPIAAVLTALDKLHWRTVSRTLMEKYKAVLDPPPAGQLDPGGPDQQAHVGAGAS